MKKSFRRVLSLILCLIMVVGAAPTGILSTEASAINTTYCATAAAQWAKDHVYDYDSVLLGTGYYNNGGDCANFVSQCLYMGGMDMSGYWNTNGYLAHWTEPYGYDYAGSFIRCVQLSNFLKSMGASVIRDPKASQVEIGDVILFYRSTVGRLGHSCIVIDIINGVPVVAAHSVVGGSSRYKSTDSGYNNDWHLGFSGSNTYLYKMNGSKCVNNNPRSFDVYTASGSPYLYSSPSASSSRLTQYISGEYTHVYQVQNGWGKTFRYGKWGWVKLSNFNYRTHIQSAPVDHVWGDWQVVTVANCQQDGISEQFCQRCGYRNEQVTKGGHITDPHAWCTSEGYCKICGVKTEDALGHKWDAGKVTKKPTCLEEGVMTYTCTRDKSHTYTEPIPALGHDFNAVVSLPNCTTTGTTQNKCSRCGYMTTVRNGNIWSEWTTDNKTVADPPAGYTYKESNTQYRYRDKQTTTSGSSSLDGWTQYDKVRTGWGSTQGPVYSDPSNSTRNVWSEQYVSSTTTHYKYYHRYGWGRNVSTGQDGYIIGTDGSFGSGARHTLDLTYQLSVFQSNWAGLGSTAYKYGSACPNGNHGSGYDIWFSDGTYAENHYSTRWYYQEPVYTYYFYRWLDWSSWVFTKYNKSDSRDVQTRTVYRYNLAALGHNFTVNVTNEFLLRDELLSASQAAGTCYSTGKKCSRCGTVSPDAVNVKHSFTKWSNLSSTEQISYCDNGCGCYITKSTECSHDWIKQSVVDPHCTSKGYTNYKCSKCGATKKDDALNALGHKNSEEWVITKPATCTDSGIETAKCVRHDNGKTCSEIWTREIPALGHTMTKFEANEMTCTKDGNTEYYYCSTCDKYFADESGTTEIKKDSWVIEATGHNAGEWIVEHPKGCGVTGWECKYCVNEWCDEHTECEENADHGAHGFLMDEREIDEITPDYYVCRFEDAAYDSSKDEWVSTTCCHGGIIYITCRNCEGTDHAHGDIPGDCPESAYVLDPLNHSWGEYIYEKASCVHSGFKYKICQSCETENCENCVYDKEVIDAPRTEHQYVLAEEIATECTAGTPMQHWVCAICGQTECDTCAANEMPHHYWTGDPQKHELVLDPERSWEATCVDEGNNHYKCAKCEYCYDEAIEPKGHKMALSNTIEPSCLEEGFEVWTCSVCGFNEKRNTTPALGHLETSPFTVTKKGTCVSNGLEEQFCARVANGQTCGVKLDEKIIPARSHNMGEWYEDPDATAEGDALCRKRDCLNTTGTDKYEACDYTETEAHKWGPWIYDGEEAKTHTKTCEYNKKETITVSCTFESEVTKKATCTEDGVRTFTCAVCGGQYTEIIPARKHNWGDWYVTVPATLTTEGEERRDCTNTTEEIEYEACDCYETRVTEVTGADYQVLIYEMDASGTYQLLSNKTYRDLIGKYVEVNYDTTTGFTFNREKSVYTGIIEKDGSLVLSLFVDRNVHTVIFNLDNGEKPDFRSLYYGANINMPDDPEKVGYEFIGWSADGKTVSVVPKTVPDRDLEYTALWKAKNYTITYNYEGGQKVATYPYTAVINEYNPPEREGYSFTGWDPVLPGNMPANNLETTATYARNAYSITYYIDGEQYGDIITYQYEEEVTPVIPDAKTGYDFSGWSPAEPINMPAKDLELYGEWKPASGIQYKIETYLMNLDGEYDLYKTDTLHGITGQDVAAVDTTGEGFTLNEEKSVLSGKILPDGSLVLKVYIDRNIHNISFDDGTNKTAENLYYGASITVPEDPEKEGYTFKGWSEDGEKVDTVLTTVPDRDVAYKAVWEINQYTITFTYGSVNGGLIYKEITQNYGTAVTKPADPSFTGYTFIGWDTNIPSDMPANNIKINALWNVNEYTIIYFVDNEKYDEKTYGFNEEITKLDEPQKQGYSFSGWDKAEPATMPAEDIELRGTFVPASGTGYVVETYVMNTDGEYVMNAESFTATTEDSVEASYSIPEGFKLNEEKSVLKGVVLPDGSLVLKVYIDRNIHKISFDPDNGENVISDDIIYGDDILIPDDPEKEGYTFEGWSEDGETVIDVEKTVPDRDIDYVAVWKVNQYTITFTWGEVKECEAYSESTQDFGTPIIVPKDPSITGYTYLDWDAEIPEKMPANDVTINALWNVNEHKVTWVVKDNRTIVTYNYGQEIIKPADPSFDGEIFIGWNKEIPETMPDYDLEFYAGFEAITHKAIFVVADENGTYSDETGTYRIVETVEFKEGQQSLPEPAVPGKEGYTGDWEEYALGKTDIVIKAVYELIDSGNTDEPEEKKNAEDNGDGTVTITLDTFAKAKNILIKGENEPIDIILVVDQSGSMKFNMDNNNEAKVGQRRRDYLVKTATSFIESVKENAESTGADHRISIVGFGMGSKGTNTSEGYFAAYLNTAVLTTTNDLPVAYDKATSAVYRNSLMSVTDDYSHISAAVNNIAYKGATAADLGFDMALKVVNANESDRKTVVIFLTDGEPTTLNGFEDGVANSAIDKAKKLKDGGATVYSVAISDLANPKDCTENFNKFLHATSSNFNAASSLNKLGNGNQANGYFVSVKDSDALQKIFDNIYVRSVAKTVNFNSVTVYDTITSDFTMTSVQEDEFRRNVIETYGVTNNDITVNRRDDGTTYLEIRNLSPKKRYDSTNVMLGWGVTVSFTVTANENALDAGEYISNTDEAGTIIGGLEAGKFLPAEVELKTNRYIVEYFIGDEVYDIQVGDKGDQISPPDVSYASWTISDDALITDRVAKYTASLGNADRKVTWNIDGKSVEESYATGQRIVAPEVNIPGKVFIGWSPTVETHMGWFDLEYTALFSTHTHSYKVTESGLCTEGITYTYTCECGDSYSEKQAPKEHRLEAVVYQTETETITHFNCNDCKYNYQRTLTFKVISSYGKETKLSLNLLNEDGVSIHKDDDKDYYYVKLPIQSLDSNSRRLVNAGKRISVVHYISADEREYCDYDVSGEYIVIHCPSFSYYVISGDPADSNTSTYDEITCDLEGHKYDWIYNGDATYKNNGTETQVCSVCGAKGITRDKENSMLKDPFANVVINVANGTVDYRTIVTLKASADNVPADFYLAIFDGDKLLVKGDNESVTLTIGEMKNTKAYTVRVVNENGETQRDANGKKLEAESTITVKGNFFKKIIAFFRWLFRSLPQATIEPKK